MGSSVRTSSSAHRLWTHGSIVLRSQSLSCLLTAEVDWVYHRYHMERLSESHHKRRSCTRTLFLTTA